MSVVCFAAQLIVEGGKHAVHSSDFYCILFASLGAHLSQNGRLKMKKQHKPAQIAALIPSRVHTSRRHNCVLSYSCAHFRILSVALRQLAHRGKSNALICIAACLSACMYACIAVCWYYLYLMHSWSYLRSAWGWYG
jgi:hypothetical protein